MKPWFTSVADLHGPQRTERPILMIEGAKAIEAAHEGLPGVTSVLIFDMGLTVQATIAGLPVRHKHDQDCGRA